MTEDSNFNTSSNKEKAIVDGLVDGGANHKGTRRWQHAQRMRATRGTDQALKTSSQGPAQLAKSASRFCRIRLT